MTEFNPTQFDTSFLRGAITDVLIIYRELWFSFVIIFNAREFSEAFYGATYPVSRKSHVRIGWQPARYHERVLLLLMSAEEIKQPYLARHAQLWRKFKHSGRCILWTPVYTKTHTCTWSFNSLTSLSINTHTQRIQGLFIKDQPSRQDKILHNVMSCQVTLRLLLYDFNILRWRGWWWSWRWEHCYDNDHGERRSFNNWVCVKEWFFYYVIISIKNAPYFTLEDIFVHLFPHVKKKSLFHTWRQRFHSVTKKRKK